MQVCRRLPSLLSARVCPVKRWSIQPRLMSVSIPAVSEIADTSLTLSVDGASSGGAAADPSPWYHAGADVVNTLLEAIHTTTGLPWWATIIAATVGVRICLAPIAIPQLRASARMVIIRPEIMRRQEEFKRITEPTQEQIRKMQLETFGLFKKYDAHPFKSIKFAVLQMPVFLSFFVALRELGDRFPEVANGGALWFTDLSVADPYLALPILSSAAFLLTMEMGTEGVAVDKSMKKAFRALGVLMIPLTYSFPQGLFLYWITNSIYAVGQVRLFRTPWARKVLNIPDPNHPNALQLLNESLQKITVKNIIPNQPFKQLSREETKIQ